MAEELYQSGFISYPRTETDSFSERTDLRVGNSDLSNYLQVSFPRKKYAFSHAPIFKCIILFHFFSVEIDDVWLIPQTFRQLFKSNKIILCGVPMRSGYWTLKQFFGEIQVVGAMTTKLIHPFIQQNILLESLDGARTIMLVHIVGVISLFEKFIKFSMH